MATATQRERKMKQRRHYAKAHRFQNVRGIQAPLSSMSLRELRKMAREYGIVGRSKMSRDDLIKVISTPRRSAIIIDEAL